MCAWDAGGEFCPPKKKKREKKRERRRQVHAIAFFPLCLCLARGTRRPLRTAEEEEKAPGREDDGREEEDEQEACPSLSPEEEEEEKSAYRDRGTHGEERERRADTASIEGGKKNPTHACRFTHSTE